MFTWKLKKHLGVIALGIGLTLALTTASWSAKVAAPGRGNAFYTATGALSCGSGGYCGYNASADPSAPAAPGSQR